MKKNSFGSGAAALALGLAACCILQAAAQPVQQAVPNYSPPDAPPQLTSAVEFVPPSTPQPMGEAAPDDAPQPKFRTRLKWDDSSTVIGELPEDATFAIKSRLGELEVKLAEVARIDRAVEKDEFRVMFGNGDRITGKMKFADATLKTAWGEVPLASEGLVSLEAGRLHKRAVAQSRRSPDGRTVVWMRQHFSEFEPKVANPDEQTSVYSPNTYNSPQRTHEGTFAPAPVPPPRTPPRGG